MHRIGRTFVRLSAENRLRVDRFRRHGAVSRDRFVNDIVVEYFDRIYSDIRRDHPLRRRRRVA